MSTAAIQLLGASKHYQKRCVFQNLQLEIPSGTLGLLRGPSGCGKSTLLLCMAMLEQLSSGELLIFGQSLSFSRTQRQLRGLRKQIGIVFQELYLWDQRSILQNITDALSLVQGWPTHLAKRRAHELADLLGIEPELFNSFPAQLSRGQRQRVAIARSLALDPQILLLDEPSASLDQTLVNELGQILSALRQRYRTVVIATHDPRLARLPMDYEIELSPELGFPRGSTGSGSGTQRQGQREQSINS